VEWGGGSKRLRDLQEEKGPNRKSFYPMERKSDHKPSQGGELHLRNSQDARHKKEWLRVLRFLTMLQRPGRGRRSSSRGDVRKGSERAGENASVDVADHCQTVGGEVASGGSVGGHEVVVAVGPWRGGPGGVRALFFGGGGGLSAGGSRRRNRS